MALRLRARVSGKLTETPLGSVESPEGMECDGVFGCGVGIVKHEAEDVAAEHDEAGVVAVAGSNHFGASKGAERD